MKKLLCVFTMAIACIALSMPSLWAASPATITLAAADTQSAGQTPAGKPEGGNIEECPKPTKPPTSGKVPEPLTVLLLSAGGAGVLALRKRLKK
jgi:hypothetical protein